MRSNFRQFANYFWVGATLLLLFVSTGNISAQVDTGQISGIISDPSSSVVAGVTVEARNLGTNAVRTTTATANGLYSFPDLPAAKYEIRVETPGFAPFTQQVEVTVGSHITMNVKLSVASTSQQVTVSAGGDTGVNTQSQELSQIVNSEQVSQLPSLTRNPYDFVAISGNVSNGDRAQGHDQNSTSRGVNFSLNGQRSTGTDILLDGVENIELFNDAVGQTVPIDSVQEYRILTSNFSAQFGRASGGVVNVITKSGSNAFHGSAWEFNRLSAYTSNTYDNNANGIPKGTYTRNQFGFAVGGPVVRDKLFFFESTEWLRTRSSANSIALVPDPAFIAAASPNTQAFFAAYGQNQPAANRGVITQSQIVQGSNTSFGPLFSALAPGTPVFDRVSYSSPTDAGGGAPTNQFYLNGRVDYNFTDKTQTYVRYALQKLTNTNGFDSSSPYPQFNVGDDATNNSVLWNISHVFNAHLLTNTKLSYTRFNLNQTFDTALQGAPSLYLFPSATILGTPTIFPGFYSTNPDAFTNGLPFGGPENTIQWNQDLNYSRGTHELQFGTQVLYLQDNQTAALFAQADEQLGTNPVDSLDGFLSGTNSRFAGAADPQGELPCVQNYLTGQLEQTPQCTLNPPVGQPSFARSNRFHDWAAYAQDSWRATPRLTLNYGVRYEYYGVQHNNNQNLDSNFYFGAGPGIAQEIRNGQVLTAPNSPNHRLWNPSYGTVAPRVGFAYDVTGDGKTSLRGGFGISYERNFGNTTFNIIENPPNYAVVELSNTPVTVSSIGPLSSSGPQPLPPTELRAVDPNIHVAQTQFWSLSLERQIVPNTVLSLQYAGARGIHLYDIKNFNDLGAGNVELGDPFRSPGEPSTTFHYSRLNNQYTSINLRGSNGDSYYDALNVKLQSTNLAHTGLDITANYTYSHNIDDISSTFSESNSSSNGVGNLGYLDPYNPGLDRGNSDIDLRQRFVLAPIWNTPWYKGQRGLKSGFLGGYHISGIYSVRSGTPFTVVDSSNSLNASFQQGIPRYAPASGTAQKLAKSAIGSNFNGTPNNFLLASLPAALNYSNPAFGGISDFGPFPTTMTGRNYFTGPGAWDFDAAISKVIPITEKFSLEARAEGFNVFNHSNLYQNGAQNDVAQYGYGTPIAIQGKKGGINPNSADNERRFGQFALKVNF